MIILKKPSLNFFKNKTTMTIQTVRSLCTEFTNIKSEFMSDIFKLSSSNRDAQFESAGSKNMD